jgi:hypothetical protein
MWRLKAVGTSTRPAKKYMAVFEDGARTRTVHFGARGYDDYTTYFARDKALARRKQAQYVTRHRAREDWSDPTTPGALSRFLLWDKPTLAAGIAAFKRRFRV